MDKAVPNLQDFNDVPEDDADHELFDENSRWPRRLLNVEDMISYRWQPGNTYGGITNPKYAIISYTWGRWRLEKWEQPSIEPLPIKGVPWEVPRVDPAHFTVAQFRHVLQMVSLGVSDSGEQSAAALPFVWLDIACIPQWADSPVAWSEIGRQARIFRGAQTAYVWLTTPTPEDVADLMRVGKLEFIESNGIARCIQVWFNVLNDPWFSSMWTLQESFIQRSAYVITNSGFFQRMGEDRVITYQLEALHAVATRLSDSHKLFEGRHDFSGAEVDLMRVKESWRQTGIGLESPMAVLAAAINRQCSFELDRVYGIMQIFGDDFVVGKAASPAGVGKDRVLTLNDLEDDLGTLILERFSIISQLFVHEEAPLLGRAWRICGRASVPTDLAESSEDFNIGVRDNWQSWRMFKGACSLSTVIVGGLRWATFEGMICPLQDVLDAFRSTSFQPTQSEVRIFMDANDGPAAKFTGSKSRSSLQAADIDALVSHMDMEALSILLFYTQMNDSRFGRDSNLHGLLLLRPGTSAFSVHRGRRDSENSWHDNNDSQFWARVGVFQVEFFEEKMTNSHPYMEGLTVDTLRGVSHHWCQSDGSWG